MSNGIVVDNFRLCCEAQTEKNDNVFIAAVRVFMNQEMDDAWCVFGRLGAYCVRLIGTYWAEVEIEKY